MLHNGLLNRMIRSTCFGHYYARHQELATIQMAPACGTSPWFRQVAGLTIQMAPACGTSPWLWQVAGLVHGRRFLERPVRGMFQVLIVMPETC